MPAQNKPTLPDEEKTAKGPKDDIDPDLSLKDVDEITGQVTADIAAEQALNQKKLKGLSRSIEEEYKHLRSHERSWVIDCMMKEDQQPYLDMLEKIPNPPVKTADKLVYKNFYLAVRKYTSNIQPEEKELFAYKERFEGTSTQKGLMDETKEVIRKLKRQEISISIRPNVM